MDGIPSLARHAVEPEIGSWDQYFDERRHIQLEGRGGIFRQGMSWFTVADPQSLKIHHYAHDDEYI